MKIPVGRRGVRPLYGHVMDQALDSSKPTLLDQSSQAITFWQSFLLWLLGHMGHMALIANGGDEATSANELFSRVCGHGAQDVGPTK